MSRFVVPVLLAALLAAQMVSLVPAYSRSRVQLVEAVYGMPEKSVQRGPVELLGAARMSRLLDEAAKRSGATPAPSRPTFEQTSRLVVARFALAGGDARAVAIAFGQALASASTEAIALVEVRESHAPWLRPVDVLAAAVNLAALALWLRRRGHPRLESAG